MLIINENIPDESGDGDSRFVIISMEKARILHELQDQRLCECLRELGQMAYEGSLEWLMAEGYEY
jgi:hypothetical protein